MYNSFLDKDCLNMLILSSILAFLINKFDDLGKKLSCVRRNDIIQYMN
jgi:hypothetical protein